MQFKKLPGFEKYSLLNLVGFIPDMISESDPRPLIEQLNSGYAHGGGWSPFRGFAQLPNGDLKYPEDPPTKALVEGEFRGDIIRIHESAWVSVTFPDGTFEVCRMD